MLRGEDETAKKYLTSSQSAMENLANIQNKAEGTEYDYRKRAEERFSRAGGTTGGAREAVEDINRKSNSELADIALQQSAATRMASLSRDVYNDYINAGKSEYEAEQAQMEANETNTEGFTLGKDQVRYDAQGNVIAGSMSGDSTGDSSGLSEWAKAINSGQAKLSDVPQEMRTGVISQLGTVASQTTSPQQQRGVDQANVALSAFDKIFANPALDLGAVNRKIGGIIPGSKSRDLKEAIGTVQALIGFNELQKMREASSTGGALGQVSEREIDFLQALAGSLKTNQSNAQLKKNLQDIQKSFQLLKLINSPDGTQGVVDSIPFGRKLAEQIPGAIFVNGQDTKKVSDRTKVYDLFAEHDDLIVIATVNIAGTGLSINRIFNLVTIDIGKAFTRVMQAIGRGLRTASDKNSVIVTDICSDLKYSKKHIRERKNYYDEAKYKYKQHKINYTKTVD